VIYEIRTYTLAIQGTPPVEKNWGDAYPNRMKYSPIVGFFHTDVGPLNEVIHIWPYKDLEERRKIREAAATDPGWPPNNNEYITNQRVEVVTPFPFSPDWQTGKQGPVFELRQYSYRPGALPSIMEHWEKALPKRLELSNLMLIGNVEFGPTANSFVHIWAYESMNHRNEVRAKAIADGIWPPPGGKENYLTQHSKIMLPAGFSPTQ
jgi:hypothetical protein